MLLATLSKNCQESIENLNQTLVLEDLVKNGARFKNFKGLYSLYLFKEYKIKLELTKLH